MPTRRKATHVALAEHFNFEMLYLIASEAVRLTALAALILSYWRKDVLEAGVLLVMAYCCAMFLLHIYAGDHKGWSHRRVESNVFWFKKNQRIIMENALGITFFYIYGMVCTYFFAAKHIRPSLLHKSPGK